MEGGCPCPSSMSQHHEAAQGSSRRMRTHQDPRTLLPTCVSLGPRRSPTGQPSSDASSFPLPTLLVPQDDAAEGMATLHSCGVTQHEQSLISPWHSRMLPGKERPEGPRGVRPDPSSGAGPGHRKGTTVVPALTRHSSCPGPQ